MAYTTINKSSAYFNTKLYTGTGSSNAITGVGHTPSWTWIKNRATTDMHSLFDVPRGATKRISTTNTSAQATEAQDLKAFGSDGFTVGTSGAVNSSNVNYVSWNWKAGTTSGLSTNGDTDITPSSYSFSQISGFSIIRYTGIGGTPKQIPHGLGVKPKMFIIKRINGTGSWGVLPQQLGTGHLYLDGTQAISNTNPLSGGVLADAVNFSVSSSGDVNASGGTYVAYCFADVQGYSKIGSYIGNGIADGTFSYTGFKPAWILIKRYNAGGSWRLIDNKRIGYNRNNYYLTPNTTGAEGTGSTLAIDMLSNGFKVIGTDIDVNTNGGSYMYMAFAEAPLVGSNNVPANAR